MAKMMFNLYEYDWDYKGVGRAFGLKRENEAHVCYRGNWFSHMGYYDCEVELSFKFDGHEESYKLAKFRAATRDDAIRLLECARDVIMAAAA